MAPTSRRKTGYRKWLQAGVIAWLLGWAGPATAGTAPAAPPIPLTGLATVTSRFVSDPGLEARYLMTEGSGTTLNDSSGNGNTISFGSVTTLPIWTGDSTLNWAVNTSYLTVPSTVQNVTWATVEICGAVPFSTINGNPNPFLNTPIGYGGADPATAIEIGPNYGGGTGSIGYSDKWVGFRQHNGATNQTQGGTLTIDNGCHVIDLVINPTAAQNSAAIYVDGVLSQHTVAYTTDLSNATSGGAWSIGGSSVGTLNFAYQYGGFYGKIVGAQFSSTLPTAPMIAQNDAAWAQLAQIKGVAASYAYGATGAPVTLAGFGESLSWCHGCTSPATQGFLPIAAGLLTTSLGLTTTSIVDGNDSNTGYLMTKRNTNQPSPNSACGIKFHAMSQSGGLKIAVLSDNANSERELAGLLSGLNYWPGAATISAQVSDDFSGLSQCVADLHKDGWKVILADANSANATAPGYPSSDTAVKDVRNPVFRNYWGLTGADAYWNYANDRRLGRDGAALAGETSTDCTLLGGSAGPSFQSDAIHPSVCMFSTQGQQLAAVVMDMVYRQGGTNPYSLASTSYTMALTDLENTITLTGSGAAFALLPCGGLPPGTRMVTLVNGGSAADTIIGGTEYNGGAADQINGAATYSLAAGASKAFKVAFGGDAAGTCSLVAL